MTKKSEMAEWILDFFRKSNMSAGQIILMRSVQNKVLELNPRERDLFVPVVKELVDHGYFTYEEGNPQYLRLTEKGQAYIYNSNAELDCCQDRKYTPIQAQYIKNWHDGFVAYVQQWRIVIAGLMMMAEATEEDKRGLEQCLQILADKESQEIERLLGEGIVNKVLLDMLEKLNKELVDVAVEHLQTNVLIKEFWKRIAYMKIEQEKKAEESRLSKLNITE